MRKKANEIEIKKLMFLKGFNLKVFSDCSGVGMSHLSRIINGKHSPNGKTAKKIADALGVEIEDIFEFDIKEEVR